MATSGAAIVLKCVITGRPPPTGKTLENNYLSPWFSHISNFSPLPPHKKKNSYGVVWAELCAFLWEVLLGSFFPKSEFVFIFF